MIVVKGFLTVVVTLFIAVCTVIGAGVLFTVCAWLFEEISRDRESRRNIPPVPTPRPWLVGPIYKDTYDRVKVVIDAADIENLFALGAPGDEYHGEIDAYTVMVLDGSPLTPDSVREVWMEFFDYEGQGMDAIKALGLAQALNNIRSAVL